MKIDSEAIDYLKSCNVFKVGKFNFFVEKSKKAVTCELEGKPESSLFRY